MSIEMERLSPPSEDFLRSKGRVTTLGMFIIDHHAVRDEQGNQVMTEEESIGGGGVFAMVSARMFLPASHCGLLIDCGLDFPQRFADTLDGFGAEMIWYRAREGKTTRALNIYSGSTIGEGHQSFKYLSPQLNLLPHDLILPPSPFCQPYSHLPEYIHVVCNTQRARLIIDELEEIRSVGIQGVGKGWDPKMIWEPMPSSCVPSELDDMLQLIPSFYVFSPNLLELQSILGITLSSDRGPCQEDTEKATKTLFDLLSPATPEHMPTTITAGETAINIPAIIVRSGELGSYTYAADWKGWVTPYYGPDEQDKVVDPTGGGNSFLGGLAAGLMISQGDMRIASIYAATAASFTIEQRGLPTLTKHIHGERWNGDDPWRRLREMASRVDQLEKDSRS
ncbi:uncharacterized protein I303_100502 [Kwoniella dejecticola CBS 10117]|uniref:Carbohydrate kinase PfkB domain-containing protein n=1 Tax=Kwoniella dejecticola CBS 10117 TaxID=1296121 RepID=A0A1A6AF37_9TREE|nr:uncharacterized protein I303_00502 [Kwoniella dejecticola CBS 10117]OBR88685.1 hypothetical protein I303_00502 [Kwoniella dejecticola CBS 10117]